MTFKRTFLLLLAALSVLCQPGRGFANSVSPISGFRSQERNTSIQPRIVPALVCDPCDHTIEGGAIRTEMALPELRDTVNGIYSPRMFKAADSESAFADWQFYSSLTGDKNKNKDWAVHYPVVEPGTLTLFGTGLVFLAGVIRRKTAKS